MLEDKNSKIPRDSKRREGLGVLMGKYAINDTATEVRHLRNLGVSVLGVFAGEEKDLSTEKKIFGKDFAYIRDISNFSRIVGRYLIKQLDSDE